MTWWTSAETLNRISIAAQWMAIAFSVMAALCGGVKILAGNRLDSLKADTLRLTQQKLAALEDSQRPRRLTDQQANTLIMELSVFATQRIEIDAHIDDFESVDFALSIQKVLMSAGWDAKGVENSGFHNRPGVWIWYEPGSKAEVAAKRLVTLLGNFHFQTNIQEGIADQELIVLSTGRRRD